jgi:hypothetical protein
MFYQLITTIDGSVAGNTDDDAYLHIVYDVDANRPVVPPYVPAYQPNHTYQFIIDMSTLVPPAVANGRLVNDFRLPTMQLLINHSQTKEKKVNPLLVSETLLSPKSK